jgi:hypothetical protein
LFSLFRWAERLAAQTYRLEDALQQSLMGGDGVRAAGIGQFASLRCILFDVVCLDGGVCAVIAVSGAILGNTALSLKLITIARHNAHPSFASSVLFSTISRITHTSQLKLL